MKLSKEQSLSLAKWVRRRHPHSLEAETGEGGEVQQEFAELVGHGVGEGECIEWGAGFSNGYGAVNVRLHDGRKTSVRIHRAVRQILEGESDLEVAHSCGNKACFNPNHTRYSTTSENVRDRFRLGETVNVGETSHLAKLKQVEVEDIRARYVKGNRWHPGNSGELMAEYDISPATLSMITTGKIWRN